MPSGFILASCRAWASISFAHQETIDYQKKAYNLGADAIVGIRFDTDEISGKGKNMFMLNVTGTAVKLKPITE